MNFLLVALGSMALISNFWLIRERNSWKLRHQRDVENEKRINASLQKKLEDVICERDSLQMQLQYEEGIKTGKKTDFLWQELRQQVEGEEKSAVVQFNHRTGAKK